MARSMNTPRQNGQALPLVLVFLIVLSIGLLVIFNTGQVVNKKVELTNTADAAAYSVAVEQARAWNTAAYMNRGRIANEVAVAQVVSLNSWATQVNVSANMTATYSSILKAIPYIGAAFAIIEGLARSADNIMRGVRRGIRTPSAGVIAAIDGLNWGYAETARFVVGYGSETGVGDLVTAAQGVIVARDVVQKNLPEASISSLGNFELVRQLASAKSEWLTQHTVPGTRGANTESGNRYRNLVMESRDKFTVERRDSWMLAGVIGFHADGGTDMVDYRRWSAVDTHNFRVRFNAGFFRIRLDLPLGWAGAQALPSEWGTNTPFFPGMGNGRGWYSDYRRRTLPAYNGLSANAITSRMAASDPGGSLVGGNRNDAFFHGYSQGISHTYHDVTPDKLTTPEQGPVFTVELQIAESSARTSASIDGMGAGRLEMPEGARGGNIKALSSAQVYFNRPHAFKDGHMFRRFVRGTQDDRYEMASLFSPYWQARLVDTPDGVKSRLAVMGGVP